MKKVEEHELIAKIKELHKEHGKTPTLKEFSEFYSTSTVHKHGWNNLIKKAGLTPNMTHVPGPDLLVHKWEARILFLDIETSALLVRTYGLYNQNIPIQNIVEDWSLLSYCAKFNDDETVYYLDQRYAQDYTDDRQLVEGIHDLIRQADIIVAHNIDFDWGKLNAKFIKYELDPLHPRQICTLKMTRKLMKKGITSKKLEFLAKWLGCTPKESHAKFPGGKLWDECLKGNMEAWAECEVYNRGDVTTLTEIFWKLSRYDQSINFSIYEHKNKCICGSDHFVRDGYKVTNSSKKMRFRCGACGKVYTARIEELPTKLKQGLFQ
jgi:hypothetical protein